MWGFYQAPGKSQDERQGWEKVKRSRKQIQDEHTPLGTLTESGSRCCSRKAENSTRRSLVVPMERPCQAGTEGAGADAGSNPEKPMSPLYLASVALRPQTSTGAGLFEMDDLKGKAKSPQQHLRRNSAR